MDLPTDIKNKLDELTSNVSLNELKSKFEKISSNYLNNDFKGNIEVSSSLEVLTYALSRMPATFSANYESLNNSFSFINKNDINSVISLGSGTGSDVIALTSLLDVNKVTCIEKQKEMINLMKSLLSDNSNIEYINDDFNKMDTSLFNADLVIASYSLNELNQKDLYKNLDNMINMSNNYILIVEPATMNDFSRMKEVRKYLINKGLNIVSPCPHCKECKSNWCHFVTRVNRSKIHKLIKQGDSPYEDEKYTYLFASKVTVSSKKEFIRIMRHPLIYKGYVELEGCYPTGEIKKFKITKSDKEQYKRSKKMNAGDSF